MHGCFAGIVGSERGGGTERMKSERSYAGVLLCFFLSGFAALLYQTAWTREFSFVFGTSELAVATVLAGYMGGLSLGAAVAGRLAHRVRRPVWVYGLLELGIAVTALALPLAMQGVRAITVWAFAQPEGPPAAGGVAVTLFTLTASFVILVIPTALMGATLPLLSRHAVHRDNQIGSRVGVLYAINTLGAIAGTIVAGFALLPALGLHQTVLVGVGVNAGVFVLAALLARGEGSRVFERSDRPTAVRGQRAHWILPLILVSGMVSFSYEVLWTRLLGQILGGSVYAFSTMLASFLTGITLGSALAARFARDPERSATGFAWSQLFVAVFSLAAFHLVDRLPSWVVQWDAGRFVGMHPSGRGVWGSSSAAFDAGHRSDVSLRRSHHGARCRGRGGRDSPGLRLEHGGSHCRCAGRRILPDSHGGFCTEPWDRCRAQPRSGGGRILGSVTAEVDGSRPRRGPGRRVRVLDSPDTLEPAAVCADCPGGSTGGTPFRGGWAKCNGPGASPGGARTTS